MYILVHLHDPAEQAALCRMLQVWATFSCVSMQVLTQEPGDQGDPAILFWDLDGPPPVRRWPDCPLILCSRDPRQAIGSYCFHPVGFLPKPIPPHSLWTAMDRCAGAWYPALQRLPAFPGRDPFPLPLRELMWAEGDRRGCRLHTLRQTVTIRAPLYRLAEGLPAEVFCRCQRSFLVNITYVQQIAGPCLLLQNGSRLPLSRRNRAGILAAHHQYRRLRYGQ